MSERLGAHGGGATADPVTRGARVAMVVLVIGAVVKLASLMIGTGVATVPGTALTATALLPAAVWCRGLAVDERGARRLRTSAVALGVGLLAAAVTLLGADPRSQPHAYAAGSVAGGLAVAVGAVALVGGVGRWLRHNGEQTARRWWQAMATLVVASQGVVVAALAGLLVTVDPDLLTRMETGAVDPAAPGADVAAVAFVGFVGFLIALVQIAVEALAGVTGATALRRHGKPA